MSDIDERVATEVMGECTHQEYSERYSDVAMMMIQWCSKCGRNLEDCKIKPYSTNIAHAWEVVEKLRKDGYEIAVWCNPHRVICQIGKDSKSVEEWIADEDSENAPLAICKAALKAKERE